MARKTKVFDEQQMIVVGKKLTNGVRVMANRAGVHLCSGPPQSMNPSVARRLADSLIRAAEFAEANGCHAQAMLNGEYYGPELKEMTNGS